MSFNNPLRVNGAIVAPNQFLNNYMQIPNPNLNNFIQTPNPNLNNVIQTPNQNLNNVIQTPIQNLNNVIQTPNPNLNNKTINPNQGLQKLDRHIAYVSKSLCFIDDQKNFGSGFLLKLFRGDQKFDCLITCEHIVKREMIKNRKTINFFYDSMNAKTQSIKLDPDKRFIQDFIRLYEIDKSLNIDATIIEILPEDNISDDYFLYIDEQYINNLESLKNQNISIIQYPKGDLNYAFGQITNIDVYQIFHTADTKKGSSGSPILLRNTSKVIGIHTSGDKIKNINYGYCLGPIFNYFKYFSRNKMELNIKLYDRHTDINTAMQLFYLHALVGTKVKNDKINEVSLFYEIKGNSVQIFGQKFVENNIDNCDILINGEEQRQLCSTLKRNEVKLENNRFKITLIEKNMIYNMSSMFCNCNSLKYLQYIDKWNTENVTNMSSMFFNCSSLEYFPDISKWNTSNVKDMRNMFGNCTSLKTLADISNWDLSNVTNVDYMFSKCISLTSLPDISKWNTSNIRNMSYMFSDCVSLKALPDLSKWNISRVNNMSYMFQNCRSLTSLNGLSKWKIREDIEKENMFEGCFVRIIPENFKEQKCCLIY